MLRRAWFRLLMTATIGIVGLSDAAAGQTGTGDRSGGWLFESFGASGKGTGAAGGGGMLRFLPAEAAPGTILAGIPLPAGPEAMASLDRRVVVVFRPMGGVGDPVVDDEVRIAPIRQVREVVATPGPRPPIHFFSEPTPLPPLEGEGALEGFVLTVWGPMAVMVPGGRRLGDQRRMLELVKGAWSEAEGPMGLEKARPFALGTLEGEAALFQNGAAGRGRLWIRDRRPGAGGKSSWIEREMESLPAGVRLIEAQGQILAVTPGEGGGGGGGTPRGGGGGGRGWVGGAAGGGWGGFGRGGGSSWRGRSGGCRWCRWRSGAGGAGSCRWVTR